MLSHIFGWLSLFGVLYATLLYFWNIFNPHQKEDRLSFHCNISKLTILTITAHLISQPIDGFANNWVIWSGLCLYLVIMVSGIILMYLPRAGSIRYNARAIHSSLLVGLGATLFHHILTMLKIL
jgi:hypothetical protein